MAKVVFPKRFDTTELAFIRAGWVNVNIGDMEVWAANGLPQGSVTIFKPNPDETQESIPVASFTHTQALNYMALGMLYLLGGEGDRYYDMMFKRMKRSKGGENG